jgi:hypothetical protein
MHESVDPRGDGDEAHEAGDENTSSISVVSGTARGLEPAGVVAGSGGLLGGTGGADAVTTTIFFFLRRLFISRLPLGGGSNYQMTHIAF